MLDPKAAHKGLSVRIIKSGKAVDRASKSCIFESKQMAL